MAAYEMRNSDWSSDVCSSDLAWKGRAPANAGAQGMERVARDTGLLLSQEREGLIPNRFPARVGTARIGRESRGMTSMLTTEQNRSEERRGGKECCSACRSPESPTHKKKNNNQDSTTIHSIP